MALTPKQERFCEEYLVDLNSAAAYRRAGYVVKNDNVAAVEGHRLLSNPNVQVRVAELQAVRSERTQITADNVLREIALLAFADLSEILDFDGDTVRLKAPKDIPKKARKALSAMKVKRVWEGTGDSKVPVDVVEFKLWSKTEALRDLGRHLKLFTDNVDVNIPDIDALIAREFARIVGPRQTETAGAPAANPDAVAGSGDGNSGGDDGGPAGQGGAQP